MHNNQFEHATVIKRANIYFDGKCVSHDIHFPDGARKSLGVIFPSTLKFNTGTSETMEINAGKCRIRLQGESDWKTYEAGQQFSVPSNSSFDIETTETVDYVCHYGG